MRLILVRHGETACNKLDIWHGWDECCLTELGQSQASAVGTRLAAEPIDVVYSSPSRRALETATAIAEQHGLEPIVDERFRERNPGEFEGKHVTEVVASRPTVWEERDADLWGWRPPGGESFQDVLDRVHDGIRELERRHPNETVAVATHMGPVRVLTCEFAGVSIEDTYRMEFPSTGVSIFELDGGIPRIITLNDAAHVS